jgi:branched-chain amino acid transport system substrate-binding protein
MKRFGFLALCLTVFGLVLMPPVSHGANTIKVGMIDTYTGPASALTLDILDAFKMSVAKINAAGGVLGRQIEYAVRDDKFKPDIGLNMAKELILREKVDMLVGTLNRGLWKRSVPTSTWRCVPRPMPPSRWQ